MRSKSYDSESRKSSSKVSGSDKHFGRDWGSQDFKQLAKADPYSSPYKHYSNVPEPSHDKPRSSKRNG